MRTVKAVLSTGALLIMASVVVVSLTAANPPLPVLPGINAKDPYPQGCVSCHVKSGSSDLRIPSYLKSVKDHPDITTLVKVVPDDCIKCHKEGGVAKPQNQIDHLAHFSNPDKNFFVTGFTGSCLNCHALDASGQMKAKSGPKNW